MWWHSRRRLPRSRSSTATAALFSAPHLVLMTGGLSVRGDGIYLQDFGLFKKRPRHFYLLAGEVFRRLLIAQYVHVFAIVQRVLAAAFDAFHHAFRIGRD